MITRRTFLGALAGGSCVIPLAAEAQQRGRVPRIGVLLDGSGPTAPSPLDAFRGELRELGWTEGQNILIEYRWAEGKLERLPELAAELVRLKVEALIAPSTPAAKAAKNATATIPIVFVTVSDPVADGLVTSLARPGGNVTGVSNVLPEQSGKLLELIKEVVPGASRVAVLWNPGNPGKVLEWKRVQVAAPLVGVTLRSFETRAPRDLEAAFGTMTRERPDALVVFVDGLTFGARQQIADFAARNRLPSIYQVREYVQAGGLMSYGLSFADHFRRAAVYVDKILKGAKPADLPVEQPTKFELVLNLKTARALGLTIPSSVLLRADEVIQ